MQNAGWDINAVAPLTDLGVPAFNEGIDFLRTGDYGNGLGVMINSIQYVFVIAQDYYYDQCKGEYHLDLRYIFYDVFGLDDDDLDEYGAKSPGGFSTVASVGVTAWWQLQHQHGYAPLITRIILDKSFTVPVP